jgi:4-amino-4-deoxy-L-arabinose transferase-like glycosyltransferase
VTAAAPGREEQEGFDRLALGCAAMVFALRYAFIGHYDLFRDELYFIVCGQHPAFGYADQPPLVPLIAAASYKLGLGAWGVRIPAALAAGALVWLAVRFVRLLGGNGIALALAVLTAATAPMLMGVTTTLNTTTFDPLAWTAIVWLVLRALRLGDDRALLWAGLVAGLALEMKYSLVFWLAGLVAGLLVTPERRLLARPALWGGLAVAALLAAPSAIWQALHGMPFLELGKAAAGKNVDVPLGEFLANQVMVMNPLYAPIWLAGLVGPFVSPRLRDLRFVPVACLAVLVIVRLGHGKDYYLAPCYPVLFAIGAVAIGGWAQARWRKGLVGTWSAAGLVVSALAAPMAIPLLSPEGLAAWIERLGIAPQQQERSFAGTVLPQIYADQLGWHDFTAQVSAAWAQVPEADRPATAILAGNYGEAASLDLYARGLPPVLSGHNQYWLWGLRGQNPRHLLVVTRDPAELATGCGSVTVLGRTYSKWAVAHENGKAIALCRDLRQPLNLLWAGERNFS